jgi:hypothetical protein
VDVRGDTGGTRVTIEHRLDFRFPVARAWLEKHVVSGYFIEGIARQTLARFKLLAERSVAEQPREERRTPRRGYRDRRGDAAWDRRAAFWDGVLSERRAVAPITRFDAAGYRSRIAAQVDDFEPREFLSAKRAHWTDRFSQFSVAAARMALEDAGYRPNGASADVGVYLGSALGGLAFADEQHDVFRARGLDAVRPLLALSVFGGAASCNVAIEFGLRGPTIANANSCAAGAVAIGEAARAIARGDLRAALAGGVEAPLSPLVFGAFTVIRAMSERNNDPPAASRPFDVGRDGTVTRWARRGHGKQLYRCSRWNMASFRAASTPSTSTRRWRRWSHRALQFDRIRWDPSGCGGGRAWRGPSRCSKIYGWGRRRRRCVDRAEMVAVGTERLREIDAAEPDRRVDGAARHDGRVTLDDDALTALRRDRVGTVFQFFNLLPALTVADNVALPLVLQRVPTREIERA